MWLSLVGSSVLWILYSILFASDGSLFILALACVFSLLLTGHIVAVFVKRRRSEKKEGRV